MIQEESNKLWEILSGNWVSKKQNKSPQKQTSKGVKINKKKTCRCSSSLIIISQEP